MFLPSASEMRVLSVLICIAQFSRAYQPFQVFLLELGLAYIVTSFVVLSLDGLKYFGMG